MLKTPISSVKACYTILTGKKGVNVYELISAVTILSYANWKCKVRFLVSMFDFEERGKLNLNEVALLLESSARGIGRMTKTPVPKQDFFDRVTEQLS